MYGVFVLLTFFAVFTEMFIDSPRPLSLQIIRFNVRSQNNRFTVCLFVSYP